MSCFWSLLPGPLVAWSECSMRMSAWKSDMCMSCMCVGVPFLFHPYLIYQPSIQPGSGTHPIQTGSEVMASSGPDDSCTAAYFWMECVWPKPDTVSQNQIGLGLVLHNMVRAVCATKSKSGKLVAGQLRSARTGPNDSCILAGLHMDPFGQNQTKPSRSDLAWFCRK